ncbi:ABC transporter permease [Herbaspirillum autotrophicum]|uniref:ABC transporter permease n=1 Tax=Herbaspirillum autotrophicum TaxID=180195 RepID=UPI00067B43A2|nr:ABC transporter permease [Herbaspirillum autotrophicum]
MKTQQTVIIDASSARSQYWRDLWRYRDLLYFLSWRDILVRYKETVIGLAWAVLRPFLTMVIFTIVFGQIAKLPSNGVPYPLMVFAAMLPWYFFSSAFTESGNSLLANSNMISKVYFPRLIIPASTIAVCLVDLLISFVIMFGMMLWYQVMPTFRLLVLPLFILYATATAMGIGLWCAALNVKYRDFRYIIPFVAQIGLYVSPVGFDSSMIPEQWRLIYYINPMVAVIDGFRWSLLGQNFELYWPGFILSLTLVVTLLVTGITFFRRTENTFADVI